jgi:HAD superfamily phosphatase
MWSMAQALLFDMDGVLVDVSRSFREVIRAVVQRFTGEQVQPSEIQALKQSGGFNDDVKVSAELLARRGHDVTLDEARRAFDEIYQGEDGLWRNERWLVPPGTLERLGRTRRLGVVTGRNRAEVDLARRLAGEAFEYFGCVITQEDVPGRGKPEPDGLLRALEVLDATAGAYVGDAVDDMRAARAANLRAIGVLPPGVDAGEDLADLMRQSGAQVVLDSIEMLEDHL